MNVRSKRIRDGRSDPELASGAETEKAIVEPLRPPTNVNEHFWTVKSPERASIKRRGLSPGN